MALISRRFFRGVLKLACEIFSKYENKVFCFGLTPLSRGKLGLARSALNCLASSLANWQVCYVLPLLYIKKMVATTTITKTKNLSKARRMMEGASFLLFISISTI